jgi:hypothetical protein
MMTFGITECTQIFFISFFRYLFSFMQYTLHSLSPPFVLTKNYLINMPVLLPESSALLILTDAERTCFVIIYFKRNKPRSTHWTYRISRPIRRTFFPPEKCDLNLTCVLCAEGKYYVQTYKYPYSYYTSLSWNSEICFQIMRSGITACERLTFL